MRRVLKRYRAMGLLSPVASALDAVQRVELVHRDVKPRDILVDVQEDQPDHVYLSDFGITEGPLPPMNLAVTGQFLGTPGYAAPEQIQGRAVDGRAAGFSAPVAT